MLEPRSWERQTLCKWDSSCKDAGATGAAGGSLWGWDSDLEERMLTIRLGLLPLKEHSEAGSVHAIVNR